MKTRIFAVLLTIALFVGMLPVAVFAETEAVPTLISAGPEAWFEEAMDKAVENGLMIGWNGDLMPDDNLTKAQMATIINRAFGAVDMADISGCPDVTEDDWFYGDMAKAVMMGTVDPDDDGYLYPGEVVTREQVFTALADAFGFYNGDAAVLDAYDDKDDISGWAVEAFACLVENGYVQGYDGMLNPKGYITRAEFAVVMDNLVKTYIDEAGDYTDSYEGNVMLRVEGVNLLGLTIDGDLLIGDGVGDGEVYMEDVEVTGRTLIRGGGRNSILVKGESYLQDIVIKRVNGELRIDGSNETIMGDVIVDGNNNVILDGFFGTVTVLAPDVIVNAASARIMSGEVIGENSMIIVYDYAVVNPGPGMKLLSLPPEPQIVETPAEYFGFDPDTGRITSYDIDGGTDVVVPKMIEGVAVTGIEDDSFLGMETITSMYLQEGITYIGRGAFKYCYNLAELHLPNSLETIDRTAFHSNDSLTSVYIPDGVSYVGRYAFAECDNLVSVHVPASFEYVSEDDTKYIFSSCPSLSSVTFGTGISELGAFMFHECDSLTSLTIPNGITRLPAMLFRNCYNLVSVNIPSSVTYLERGVFKNCYSLQNFSIPSTITTVEDGIFDYCTSLTEMTVPATLTSIGDCLFSNCSNLETITVESGIETIPPSSFKYCQSLTTVSIPDTVTTIDGYAFYQCSSLESFDFPDNLEVIGQYAFMHCESLDGITIPNTVSTIASHAFTNCYSLSSVTLPTAIEYLGDYSFAGCSAMTSLTLNSGLTVIGAGAFSWCTSLTSVVIPASVTAVYSHVFSYSGLTEVTFSTTSATIYSNAFYDCDSLGRVTFADRGLTLYNDFLEAATVSYNLRNAYYAYGGGTYVRDGSAWNKLAD